MEESFFDNAVTLLSNNFEFLLYFNGFLILVFILISIIVRLRFVPIRKLLHSTVRIFLLTSIIAGQAVLVTVIGYLYWENYQKPAPELELSTRVSATTHWVKNDLRIYFIDNNVLGSIRINGKGKEDVFRGSDPIKEYHFSPDGRHLLILTQKDLYLLNRTTNENKLIDSLKMPGSQTNTSDSGSVQGSIGSIQWAPDSQKFIYEIARWSQYSSQDNIYIYSIKDHSKKAIRSPARRISSLYWGAQGDGLYFLHHEVQEAPEYSSAFEVKVFRISLASLTPELITTIPFERSSVPIENLNLRGIDLYLDGGRFSFDQPSQEDRMVYADGPMVSIDESDHMYYKPKRWFRKRLFRIPREAAETDMPRYQYKGGDLVVDHIRWIPGGRYVIMEHKYWGVLILEPSSGRIGLLIEVRGNTFGWYQGEEA